MTTRCEQMHQASLCSTNDLIFMFMFIIIIIMCMYVCILFIIICVFPWPACSGHTLFEIEIHNTDCCTAILCSNQLYT